MTVRAGERNARDEALRSRESGATGGPAGFALLAGVYLILSPWIIQFTGTFSMAASNTITGIVLALLAVGCVRPAGPGAVAWVVPVLGAWVISSPWVIFRGPGFVPLELPGASALTTATWLSNVVAGAVVLVAGVVLTMWTRADRHAG
jgi:hypothetical protein